MESILRRICGFESDECNKYPTVDKMFEFRQGFHLESFSLKYICYFFTGDDAATVLTISVSVLFMYNPFFAEAMNGGDARQVPSFNSANPFRFLA